MLVDSALTGDIQAIAPDERHIAVSHDYLSPCPSERPGAFSGIGTLSVVTIDDASRSATTRVAATGVSGGAFFSTDSQALAFVDGVVDPCVRGGHLELAAADGTGVRRIRDQVLGGILVGDTLLFSAVGTNQAFAMSMHSGAPVQLGNAQTNAMSPNSLGTAVAYTSDGYGGFAGSGGSTLAPRSIILVDTFTGTEHVASDRTTDSSGILQWSNGGQWLAFVHQPMGAPTVGLGLVASDGSMRTEISTDCVCEEIVFSPDDGMIAYDASDGNGGGQLEVYRTDGGAKVTLTGLPAPRYTNYIDYFFSHDATYLFATVRSPNNETSSSLYGAPVAASGPMQLLSSDLDHLGSEYPSPAGDAYLAVQTSDGTVEVLPLAGGVPVPVANAAPAPALPIDIVGYEPTNQDPRLLLFSNPGSVMIAATDGSTSTSTALRSPLGTYPRWLKRNIFYESVAANATSDLNAITDDGAQDKTLAVGVGPSVAPGSNALNSYAWAPIASPSLLFFIRQAANAGGAAGLWMNGIP